MGVGENPALQYSIAPSIQFNRNVGDGEDN